ncbi:hypothetical protein SLVCU150_0081 [Staphylococcus lugdunensis VCU150]|nr:hypothetical protein SLVCU150_0081 [Staphylococcus lugdunensis VCU150]KAK55680.1 hypothetical protein SLVCU148_0160 [Staphylococcus lugdunensis VCU148]BBN85164.1 hypothetical protein MRSL_12580 [Staphylococcus lugdunensis]
MATLLFAMSQLLMTLLSVCCQFTFKQAEKIESGTEFIMNS